MGHFAALHRLKPSRDANARGEASLPGSTEDGGWCPDSEVRIIVLQTRLRTSESKGHEHLIDSSVALVQRPHDELAAILMRTSQPPH
jgi:hypothetical protein